MSPTFVRRMDCAHVLMSDGWVHRLAADAASEPTVSTTQPRSSFERRRANASPSNFELGVRRGKQRWSALVSAPTSRLAKCMRARLGDALWADFVSYANAHYKPAFVRMF